MNALPYPGAYQAIYAADYCEKSRKRRPIFRAIPLCLSHGACITVPRCIIRLCLTIGLLAVAGCGGGFLGDNPDASQMEKTIFDTHDADSTG